MSPATRPAVSPRSAPPAWALLCGVFAAALGASAARADAATVKAVQDAYAALDYEGCTENAGAALEEAASKDERVETYKHLGLCSAALGDSEAANEAFIKMLAIDRSAKLPEGLSPRFTSSYLEAKGHWVGREAMAVTIDDETLEGTTRVLRLRIINEAELIDRIAWRGEDGELSTPVRAAERMEFEAPDEIATALVAVDEWGGEVVVLSLKPATPAPDEIDRLGDDAAADKAEAEDEGSFLTSPWLWLGVGGAAAFVVVAAASTGAVVGYVTYEPQQVDLNGGVAFGD